MKSYKNVYDVIISESNRKEGIKAACQSRRIRKIIKQRGYTDADLLELSYDWITEYHNAYHTPIYIYDGITHKRRSILVPTLEELVVQHCICNALLPLFTKGMYEHTYASIPNKGAHKGKDVIKKWIKKDTKNTKYILKVDIKHFFDSIPHDKLKNLFRKHVKDYNTLKLIFEIIDINEKGLPLGFYTSQWFSNWYLQSLDHYIKETLKAKYYIRYMDDIVIFGSNKKKLHRMRIEIDNFLINNLGLKLKNNYQVFLFDWNEKGRDLDFMGFRFYRNRVVLRRNIMYKATRKANHINKKVHISIYDIRQMLSYFGWFDHTNTYNTYQKYIKPCVNFKRMRNYVSKFDRSQTNNIYQKLIYLYL